MATLVRLVQPKEANAHQMNAIIVLTSAILLTHSCRKPSKMYMNYLK